LTPNNTQVASIDEQIAKLKQEIETKTQESTTRVGTARAEADIVVLAPKDATIELVVAYRMCLHFSYYND